ncbi:MAG: hypothetical protein FWC43_07330 [Planctomycetaceae bacterium]|nr:hypothetical protein [Planctomycetaceae bacterium]
MNHKSYGQLLYNAVRETLETMAFAEVVPCSFQINDEEFFGEDALEFELADGENSDRQLDWQPPVQTDFTETEQSGLRDIDSPPDTEEDSWGAAPVENSADSWGGNGASSQEGGSDTWGSTLPLVTSPNSDPWGTGENFTSSGLRIKASEINFNSLVENQEDWVWSCMRVNSPDVHSVWFVASKSLAMELAQNMYAGEDLRLDSPIIRDLVAELTNVLGGRLMLLLEKMGGQFTLAVPDIGTGLPTMPDSANMETVLCKVIVDGEFPVMSSICFNKK